MKERPIPFSGPMVRAIFDGRKTQTRRVVNFPLNVLHFGGNPVKLFGDWPLSEVGEFKDGYLEWECQSDVDDTVTDRTRCPYGVPGDRLWVREAWKVGAWRGDGRMALDYLASPEIDQTPWLNPPQDQFMKLKSQSYEDCDRALSAGSADIWEGEESLYEWQAGHSPCRRRPSRFMPRWASRIDLEITAVRVERVQEISEEDAFHEGGELPTCPACGYTYWDCRLHGDHRLCGRPEPLSAIPNFATLWDSINAKRGFPWALNPWVWVIEFRRLRP